ncbi:MAG: N-acetylneuraminate synthase [Spartobacteria bacterium]|nr:N-acetylneuraminate synthase [Spartobacteria bacterium]
MKTIQIDKHTLGPGHPCFIIAEAGVNHNGSVATAIALVEAAVAARADAIKFQTFHADKLVTHAAPKAAYQRAAANDIETQYEMLRRLELSEDAHLKLIEACKARGILFLSSPFDTICADFLASLNIPAFKIGSGELTNHPLLAHVARFHKPVILSTGMATLEETQSAIDVIRAQDDPPLVLLHCVSNYPTAPEDVNLRAMDSLSARFDVPVGFSDHTPGIEIAIAAAARGACVIEKHFTLDHTAPGPDHEVSLEPEELAAMVRAIRHVESALGDGIKQPVPTEMNTAQAARKSLVAARDIPRGAQLTDQDIDILRPGTGLAPSLKHTLVGRIAGSDIPRGTLFAMDMLAEG